MKSLFLGLLGLLVFCLLLILVLQILPPQDLPAGAPHVQFTTLQSSGTSVYDSSPHWAIGLSFGLAIIGIFGVTLYIGGHRQDPQKRKSIFRAFGIGMLAYFGVFLLLINAYQHYHQTGVTPYFLGYPAPSAWMIYGIWLVPLVFTTMYVMKFDDWVLSAEEVEEFKRIVEEKGKVGSP